MTSGRDSNLPTSAGARFFYYLGSFSSRYAY